MIQIVSSTLSGNSVQEEREVLRESLAALRELRAETGRLKERLYILMHLVSGSGLPWPRGV